MLAVPLLALPWGLNWPAVKTVLGEIAPWTARTAGLGGARLVLMALSLVRGQTLHIARDQWPRLSVAGLLSIAYLVWFDVNRRLPAGVAAFGTLRVPVVGVSSAMWLLGERSRRLRADHRGGGDRVAAIIAPSARVAMTTVHGLACC